MSCVVFPTGLSLQAGPAAGCQDERISQVYLYKIAMVAILWIENFFRTSFLDAAIFTACRSSPRFDFSIIARISIKIPSQLLEQSRDDRIGCHAPGVLILA
jgi:hypothetical protein